MKRILASMTVKRSAILLVALCLLISITTVLVGGYISERTKRLEVEWIDSERDITKRIDVLSKLHNAMGFGGVIHQFKNYVLRHDEYRVEAFNTQVDSALSVIQSYRDLGIESNESAALEQIESTVRAYASKIAIAKRLIAEGQTAEQIDAVIKINDAPALQALQSLETHITSTHDHGIEEFSGRLAEISILVFSASIGFPLLLLVLAGMLGYGVWLLLKHLGGEPSDVVMISWKVANGELELPECQMKKDSSSAMGALVAMVCKLVDVIAEIRSGADSVDESAKIINEQNRELNQRTINQAANLEKTSASMEEMTATVKQNAESAFEANQLTLDARKGAEHGGEAVAEVVAAMTEIHASSQKIGDITTVIDEIAFQTNLLALNAAVEAARAGDQGRGFAVVASEVRNLAQRSAEAAKEIKVLIDDSVTKAESGAHLVNEAGDTLTELIESVQKVSSLMAEMATANEEQSQGIEQVNQAIIQMENETQQNAELVEKASEASSSMTQQAHALRNGVDFFKLRQDLDAFEKLPAVEPLPPRRPMALDKIPAVEAPPQPSQLDTLAWNGEERRSTVRPWTDNIQKPKSKPVAKSIVKTDQGNSWESF